MSVIGGQYAPLHWGQVLQKITAEGPARSGVNATGTRSGVNTGNRGKATTRRVAGSGGSKRTKGTGRNG